MDFQLYHILLLVGALDLIAAFVIRILHSKKNWPNVEGMVIAANLEVINGKYWPKVEYHFQVREETYQSNRIAAMESGFANPASAKNVCIKYPVGSTVVVYHHPYEPKKAVLNPNAPPVYYALLVSGIAFVGLGLWWMLFP